MNSVRFGSASELPSKCGESRKFATIIAAVKISLSITSCPNYISLEPTSTISWTFKIPESTDFHALK